MMMSLKSPSPSQPWQTAYLKKVLLPDALKMAISSIRSDGRTVVTINGSFDLLHAGHLHILFEASQEADCLIVALNSDASIQTNKGPSRPLIPLINRLQMVAALEFVDYVTSFEESDPRELLSVIRPNVHVNGEEYGSHCVEAGVVEQHGGRIHLVSRIQGFSTSQLIEEIKQCG